jgi:uncharacterized protein involved in exopolysaccharide biosynthesis
VESLRQNVAVREVEPVTELEFPADRESQESIQQSSILHWSTNLQLVWENRRLLYRVTLWTLVLSTLVTVLIPNRYESTAHIMPPDSQSEMGAMLAALVGKAPAGLSTLAGSFLGVKNSGALYVDLLRSRTVQEHIVDRFDLQKVYWTHYKQDARKLLDKSTEIAEDRKSGVISVTVKDRSPQRAKDITQAYVEELNRLLSQVNTSSARRERIFIEERLKSVSGDLEDAEKQFGAFASKNTALDIKEQSKAMVESGAMLMGQLIAAQSQLQSLEQIYTANNVRVRALSAQVDELKRQLEKIGGTDASLVPGATSSGEFYPSIRKLPLLGVQWADLYRRLKIQETVYELLRSQYEMARIQEAKEIPTVNVVDPANFPEKKSFPPRLLIVVLLTGLSLTAVIAWIVESARVGQSGPQDLRGLLVLKARETLSSLRSRLGQHSPIERLQNSLRRSP